MWGMKDVEELIKKHRPDYLDVGAATCRLRLRRLA